MKIIIINGPNINLLGKRNTNIYGNRSYDDLVYQIKTHCKDAGKNIRAVFFQTNHEGEIVDILQDADSKFDGIVLNAAAYSHYSIAIRDAIEAISTPVVEVHISDITKREKFRQKSILCDVCMSTVLGKGFNSYTQAIDILYSKFKKD